MSFISPCVLIFRSAHLIVIWEHCTLFQTFFFFLSSHNTISTYPGACFTLPLKLLMDLVKKPVSFPHSPSGYGHVHRGFQLIYVLPLMVILFLFFWLCHAACGILAPCCCSVAVESVSLQSHGLKHARLPCLSLFSSLTRDRICAP